MDNERALTASTPSKKEAGMYEVSNYDHLATKVDALTQKLKKLNVSAINPSSSSPPCEVCGIHGHICNALVAILLFLVDFKYFICFKIIYVIYVVCCIYYMVIFIIYLEFKRFMKIGEI